MGKKSASKASTSGVSKPTSLLEDYMLQFLARRPDPVAHEDYVNEQIEAYEEREQKRLEDLEHLEGQADEEGFVTVINKRSHQVAGQEEDEESLTRAKKAHKVLPNFYQFNVKNEKKNKLEDLRRRFEEDKERIKELKLAKQHPAPF